MSLLHEQKTGSSSRYDIAILIKSTYKPYVEKYYLKPLRDALGDVSVQVIGLPYLGNKLSPEGFSEALEELNADVLYVPDATAFKKLAKENKADPHIGYVLETKMKGYEGIPILYGISYGQLLHNANAADRLKLSLEALIAYMRGSFKEIGTTLLEKSEILSKEDLEGFLEACMELPEVAVDIETHSLKHYLANTKSIAFAYKDRAYSFLLDDEIKQWLKEFFTQYQGKLIFHNAGYDVKVLIYELWMSTWNDWEGLLEGLHIMAGKVEDTMIMAYLCINSTANYSLSLKDLAHDYAGNYAVDVQDISKLDTETLLNYNMADALATYWLYEKYRIELVKEDQEKLYRELMLPTLKVLIQTELSGMPMNKQRVESLNERLQTRRQELVDMVMKHPYTQSAMKVIQQNNLDKKQAKLKKKVLTLEDIPLEFNLNSGDQLNVLLYGVMGLPILDYTPTGKGETGTDTMENLKNHAGSTGVKLLDALIEYSAIEKVLSSFIPSFLDAIDRDDGRAYLHGSFKIGGTLCVTKETLFKTDHGVLPLEKLKQGMKVMTHTGAYQRILSVFFAGTDKVYKVTSDSGCVTAVSQNHPFLVKGKWIKAKDLKPGMQLIMGEPNQEEWKPVNNAYPYEISSWGRLRHTVTKHVAMYTFPEYNSVYRPLKIKMFIGNRRSTTKRISRIVAEAFLDSFEDKRHVKHLNALAWDNSVHNLFLYEQGCSDTEEAELFRDNRNKPVEKRKSELFNSAVAYVEELDEQPVFGVEVEHDHSHWTDGFITHNSGRLSSSSPNIQNIPSGSMLGKAIKECFMASDTELMVGADFNALEDRINTVLTKDPNKEAIYLHGYDSHSFRAYKYWPDKFPDIRQAKIGERCFQVGDIRFKGTDTIEYREESYTGEEFYERYRESAQFDPELPITVSYQE